MLYFRVIFLMIFMERDNILAAILTILCQTTRNSVHLLRLMTAISYTKKLVAVYLLPNKNKKGWPLLAK
jgi:hypothetical protein